MEVKEEKRRVVEEILKTIGGNVKVKEIRRIAEDKEKERKMIMIRVESEEQKKEIMDRKRNLRGRKEKIMDWTWKERKMEFRRNSAKRGEGGKNLDRIRKNKDRRAMVEMG